MKKALLTIVLLGLIITGGLYSQSPPFQSDNSGSQSGSSPLGGASPIEGGLLILASLGAGYSLRKLYAFHTENRDKAEA